MPKLSINYIEMIFEPNTILDVRSFKFDFEFDFL